MNSFILDFSPTLTEVVLRVQKDLKANENGEAIYDFSYQTAVMVTENKSPRGERATAEAIANGFLTDNGQKPSQKQSNMAENEEGKQPNLGSVRKASCIHAHSFISLKRKKGISETPLN